MTRVRQVLTAAILVAGLSAAAGCRREAPQTAPPPPVPPPAEAPKPPPPPPPPPPKPTPAPPVLTEEELFAKKTLEQLTSELNPVFFDLDSSEVRADARTVLQTNATWLKRWTSTQITVEGHCDSRGSSEYNLALGSRRAAAVKDYLVGLGVPENRITVVSKGKEQPFCNEETESCWQQNRRGHFLVTAK